MKKAIFLSVTIAALAILTQQHAISQAVKRPLMVSHRGANMEADENTLKAYSIAAKYGVDYIECDPRLTKDGAFVIMHDGNTSRTTGKEGKISEMTLAEIKTLKTKGGERIPTLDEVLALAKEKGVGVYLDTKEYTNPYMQKLAETVVKAGMSDKVVVGLWSAEQLKFMQKNFPEMATCIPFPTPIPNMNTAKKQGADWIGTILEKATKPMLAQAEATGLKVITLPINDRESIIRAIDDGMQVIQTDNPKLLRSIIDEKFGKK